MSLNNKTQPLDTIQKAFLLTKLCSNILIIARMTANFYIVLPIDNIHRRQECTTITKSTAKNIKVYQS